MKILDGFIILNSLFFCFMTRRESTKDRSHMAIGENPSTFVETQTCRFPRKNACQPPTTIKPASCKAFRVAYQLCLAL